MLEIKVILNYKYITCQQKLNSINTNVIICFILTPFLTLPSQPLLPSPLKLHNFKALNEPLMSVYCVCVCRFGIYFMYVIESIDSKLISVCLINDYSLIAQLLIFVYERAELSSISFECAKVKISISIKFARNVLIMLLILIIRLQN